MFMSKNSSLCLIIVCFAAATGSPVMANLIANGDFESVTGGQFDSWTYAPYAGGYPVATSAVVPIEGTNSANMEYGHLYGIAAGGTLYQQVSTTGITDFAWDFDFAILTSGGRESRTLHFLSYSDVPDPVSPGANSIDSIRVTVGGDLQFYIPAPVKQWVSTGLFANISPDYDEKFAFDGETPVVNHLRFVGSGYGTEENSLTLILNGDAYSGSIGLPNNAVKYIAFMGSFSSSDYLIDNVSFEHFIARPGDANKDGMVDSADAAILASNWLTPSGATWVMGDFNNDGAVTDEDATLLAVNWQGSASGTSDVPEPSILALLACGLLCLMLRRRS